MVNNKVLLDLADLTRNTGIYCPHPKANMSAWNSHPKIYLDLKAKDQVSCPYCGTTYRLDRDAKDSRAK
jgi:uncharacterized Zn-finger protein